MDRVQNAITKQTLYSIRYNTESERKTMNKNEVF